MMYRKLVLVLTMFAVAVGSLSQARAALASPRLPGSIATHSAQGAVQDRRATGTASAPQLNSAVPLEARVSPAPTPPPSPSARQGPLPSRSNRVTHPDIAASRAHYSRESRSRTTGTFRDTVGNTDHRPYDSRSRSPSPTLSNLSLPSTSPLRSTGCCRSPALRCHLYHHLAGTFTVTTTGDPVHVRIVCDRPASGGRVHGQRGRHRDNLGNTDHRSVRLRSRSPPRTVTVLAPPGHFILTVAGGAVLMRRVGSPALPSLPWPVGQAGACSVTSTGYPLCQLSETGALPT